MLPQEFSKRGGTTFVRLTDSTASMHQTLAAAGKQVSKRTLQRRLRLHCPRLGIGRAIVQSDKCGSCYAWDRVMALICNRLVAKATASVAECMPSYFTPTNIVPNSENLSSLVHWRRFQSFVQQHSIFNAPARSALAPASKLALEQFEGEFKSECADVVSLLGPFATHWSLRDLLADSLSIDLNEPDPNTLYVCSDWAAPCPCQNRRHRSFVSYAPRSGGFEQNRHL